jgi:ferredoxin
MQAKIDEETCIGCGLCATLYPELFEMGADGHSHIKPGVKIDSEKLKEIMQSCPNAAIELLKETE